jgi:hypothetical protein
MAWVRNFTRFVAGKADAAWFPGSRPEAGQFANALEMGWIHRSDRKPGAALANHHSRKDRIGLEGLERKDFPEPAGEIEVHQPPAGFVATPAMPGGLALE